MMRQVYIKEITTQLDAYEIYCGLEGVNHIFLDSSMIVNDLGRYSFIGINPFLIIKYKDGYLECNGIKSKGDIFEKLQSVLKEYEIENNTNLPFIAGGIGCFSYDLVKDMEPRIKLGKEQTIIPSVHFVFYDNLVICDHGTNQVFVSGMGILKDCKESVCEIEERIKAFKPEGKKKYSIKDVQFNSPFSKESYMEAVERIRQYIRCGDIYIANMTHTFVTDIKREAKEVYGVLRKINPAPFSAYLPFEDYQILSSSPEQFLRVRKGHVSTRPIKGTVPRGDTKEADEINKKRLLESEKDRAELLMIVDLERNDLSKVCEPFSVNVTELFEIESYPTVHHLIANVTGKLRENQTAVDCIKACFPGGSITGTPKIRAMEIMGELEPVSRGIYTGAIGYLGFDGSMDLNIVIRTILMKDDKAFVGVGGGITYESDPLPEYEETLIKAKALFEALRTTNIE